MRQVPLAFLLPLGAVLFVVVVAFGLGALFIALNDTGLGEWGAILVGSLIVVGVPSLGAYLANRRRGVPEDNR